MVSMEFKQQSDMNYQTPLKSSKGNSFQAAIPKTPLSQAYQTPFIGGSSSNPLPNLSSRELNLLFSPNIDSNNQDPQKFDGRGSSFLMKGNDTERKALLAMVEKMYDGMDSPFPLEDRQTKPEEGFSKKVVFEYESDLEFPELSQAGPSFTSPSGYMAPPANRVKRDELPNPPKAPSIVDFASVEIDEEFNQKYNQILSSLLSEVDHLDQEGEKEATNSHTAFLSYSQQKVLHSKYFDHHISFLKAMDKLLPSSLDLEDPRQLLGKYLLLSNRKLSSIALQQHEELLTLDNFFSVEEKHEMQAIFRSLS